MIDGRPTAGADPVASRIVELWRAQLSENGIPPAAIGPEDDVRDLGATSLDVLLVTARITLEFGVHVGEEAMFARMTIAGQAALVSRLLAHTRADGMAPALGTALVRLERRALGPGRSRGVVLGMPGFSGRTPEMAGIAANAFAAYDVWSGRIETGGRPLSKDGGWIACAREVAGLILAGRAPRPRALIGASVGGMIAWLVDRLLVAAGADPTPIVSLDGGARLLGEPAAQDILTPLLASVPPDKPARLLLLHRARPGMFRLVGRTLETWADAGIGVTALGIGSISHRDAAQPAVIARSRDAIETFIETGALDPTRHAAHIAVETTGGALFRALCATAPPTVAAVAPLVAVNRRIDGDGASRVALLFLATATGDAAFALAVARRLAAEEPRLRAATYAQVAVLQELGRRAEAAALAEAWSGAHPWDRPIRPRQRPESQPVAPWGSVGGLVVGSDASLDFAAALGRGAA